MGNTQQQQQYQAIQADAARVLGQAYGLALPTMAGQYASIHEALGQGGEPDYVKQAYGGQRAGLMEGAMEQGRVGALQARQGAQGAALGGNLQAATLSGEQMGSRMADVLYGSRVSEAMGGLEQTNKLYQSLLGQSVQAGSASMAAAGTALGNVQNMPAYNKTYANILGALNVGGSIYGGLNQQYDPYSASIRPGGEAGSSNWQGFSPWADQT